VTSPEYVRRQELGGLLQALRSRMHGPAGDGRRGGGLRQEDAAARIGISRGYYAAIERGQRVPSPATVDQISNALRSGQAERSALHILAAGQDPPRPLAEPDGESSPGPGRALRDIVSRVGPHPAAVTDELWTVQTFNDALDSWSGGWYSSQASGRNMILYLFTAHAAAMLPDIDVLRKISMANLRYQYYRNLGSPAAADLVARIEAVPQARELWERREVQFAPHEYIMRVRAAAGIAEASVAFLTAGPRAWLYLMTMPEGTLPPNGSLPPARHGS
jgi:transcriptional regulator with XRE-family HTH domain